jgi:hypothetical protein
MSGLIVIGNGFGGRIPTELGPWAGPAIVFKVCASADGAQTAASSRLPTIIA